MSKRVVVKIAELAAKHNISIRGELSRLADVRHAAHWR